MRCFLITILLLVSSVARAADEDADVAGYFKKKGWTLLRDIRISDGKRLVYLVVENRANPFADVTLSKDDYAMIAKAKTLQVLDLRKVNASDEGVKTVAGIPTLEGVLLHGEGLTDAGIKSLGVAKGLENVALFSTKSVTDAGIKHLGELPNLKTLYVMGTTLTGSAFEAFAHHKALESLTLEYVDGLTDDGLRNIAKIPGLNELKIGVGFGERKTTATGIKAIVAARLPAKFDFDHKLIDDELLELLVKKGWLYGPTPRGASEKKPATPADVRSIGLDGAGITDRGMKAVLDCTGTRFLFLNQTGVSDEAFQALAAFKTLEYVALERTKVHGPGLATLIPMPMKHVALSGCELTEDAFQSLGKMKALEELWLADAKMKADWLKHIAGLPKLRDLNLMQADFDDAAVAHLKALPNLQNLTLNNTNLTDEGFRELLKMPKLISLLIDGTKVTKESYQAAKKAHPKLRLYYYRYDQ